jgi:membrane associated rhomboid family serine protease
MIPLKDIIPTRTTPWVTYMLLGLNVLVFGYELTLPPETLERFIREWGIIPAAPSALTMLTSMFVHAGVGHAAGNMLYLWIFGDNVEDRLGRSRFILFYLLTGLVAAVAEVLLNRDSTVPMVGASGAIAGVMGGYFVLYPRSRVLTLLPFPFLLTEVPAVFFLGLWFLMQFLSGLGSLATAAELPGGVAFWAHVMGFVAGVLLVKPLERAERARVEWWGA